MHPQQPQQPYPPQQYRPPQQYGPPVYSPQHETGHQHAWPTAPRAGLPAPVPQQPAKVRNIPAILAISLVAFGLVWFWLHVMLFATVLGLAAVILGVIGNHRALKRHAPLGKLALFGVLLGLLVMLASLGG